MNDSDGDDPPDWLPLEADERISLRASPSRKLLLAAFAVASVLLVVLSALVGAVSDVGTGRRLAWVVVVLTVGTILYAFYTIRRRAYVVTNRRAVVGVGLRSKQVEEVTLGEVEDVFVERPSWQRWLGTGNVRLAGTAGRPITFAFVERPHVVAERILAQLGRGRSGTRP